MQINFYHITGDPRKVTKTLGSVLATATGVLHERVNSLQLSVRVPSTFFNYIVQSNYVGIDTTGKHYFLRSYDVQNDCVIINLWQDVLMNYDTQIRGLTCTVARIQNEELSNGYLMDPEYKALSYKKIVTRTFPVELNDFSYILMTVG